MDRNETLEDLYSDIDGFKKDLGIAMQIRDYLVDRGFHVRVYDSSGYFCIGFNLSSKWLDDVFDKYSTADYYTKLKKIDSEFKRVRSPQKREDIRAEYDSIVKEKDYIERNRDKEIEEIILNTKEEIKRKFRLTNRFKFEGDYIKFPLLDYQQVDEEYNRGY